MIDLTVKTLDSRNHSFSVPDDVTVRQLKERIAGSVEVPAESQRLIYCGRVLQDEKKLSEYDVNGKVIHLVQRPPPSANSGGNDSGGAPRSSQNSRNTSGGRRRTFQGPRLDGSNAMYLGTMAFPADLMESQGMTMPQPRHCLSSSRLSVARCMLRRALSILNRLENPNAPPETDSSADVSPEVNPIAAGEETIPGSIAVAAQVATAAAIAAAVSAAQNTTGLPSALRVEDDRSNATGTAAASAEDATGTDQSSEQAQQTVENQEGSPQSANENRNSRIPRTTSMVELLDMLNEVNRRLEPFLEQYHQAMREDPVLESHEETQRIFNQVSEVMHFLSHGYHALSDIMCDFSQPPPRYLRCRPVLIQHSAVVQTGFPIQAHQINLASINNLASTIGSLDTLTTAGSSNQQPVASQNNTASSETPVSVTVEAATSTTETAAGEPSTPTTASTRNGNERNQQPRANRDPRLGRSARAINIGVPNVEIFMDVSPGGALTIDSIDATISSSSNGSNPEVMGSFPPPPEIFQNLMQVFASQILDSGNNRQTAANTNTTSTTSQSSTAQQSSGGTQATSNAAAQPNGQQNQPSATANSQARGNTATHPTTSTQTRSTPRPHVHLAPGGVQGLSSAFDPFLPCNSHHIRASRRRSQQQSQPQQQSSPSAQQQTSSSQQESSSTPQQDSQNAAQQPEGSGATNNGSQQTQHTSLLAGLVHPTPIRPPSQRSNSDAMNNFVTVIMNMASRNLGLRIANRGTNTTATGSRTEGENVTATTQTPPLQLPNPFYPSGTNRNNGVQSSVPFGFPTRHFNNPNLTGDWPSTTLVSDLFASLPDLTIIDGESLLMDLILCLARSMTFRDLLNIGRGNPEGLRQARPNLRTFVESRLLQGLPFNPDSYPEAVDRLNLELEPFLVTAISRPTTRLQPNINLIATINRFNHYHLPRMITTIVTESDHSFHHVLYRQCDEYVTNFFAMLLHCFTDGMQGMENLVNSIVTQMTSDQGIPGHVRSWTQTSAIINFRHFLCSRSFHIHHVRPFFEYRTPSSPNAEESVEPMESEILSTFDDSALNPDSADSDSDPLPDVLLGSEDWHNALPSDWVPLISRDGHRQRRQFPQPPFSDAYLSTMPNKRRKIISSAKPQGTVTQLIQENMHAAVDATGITAPGVEATIVAQSASRDPTIRLAYRDQIRASIRQNLQSHPDFTPSRCPNAAKYFEAKKKYN